MKLRLLLAVFVVVGLAACGGGADTETAAPAPAETAAPMDDDAALEERTEYYVTHYNMHHPSMVVELYTDDAVVLEADGSVHDGKAAILAAMEADVAGSPTLTVDTADRVIVGDAAVARGTFSVEMTPEGAAEPMTVSGNFMTLHQRAAGEWKIHRLITNFDSEPAPGTEMTGLPAEAPPELADSPLAAVRDYYQTHFNMGHGSMVASMFEEDAVVAFANQPWMEGRAAVEAHLNAEVEAGATGLVIHPVGAEDLGEGWAIEGGWFEINTAGGMVNGTYMVLGRQQDDGAYRIHWSLANGHPATP
ncbi:MAG TPA: nuclear transport factor 2 family protein [Acidobacteriota bacterium]